MSESQIEKLREQLQGFDTVVLITRGENAAAHARPMAVAQVDENCDLWFFTGERSAKVTEIEADSRAQVICQAGWTSCVIVAGHVALVRDRERMRQLWKPAFKVWFPDGADDRNLLLIHFTGDQAEYWDNTGANRFTYLYQSIKAVVQPRRGSRRENNTARSTWQINDERPPTPPPTNHQFPS